MNIGFILGIINENKVLLENGILKSVKNKPFILKIIERYYSSIKKEGKLSNSINNILKDYTKNQISGILTFNFTDSQRLQIPNIINDTLSSFNNFKNKMFNNNIDTFVIGFYIGVCFWNEVKNDKLFINEVNH